jgi:hypothetical protein
MVRPNQPSEEERGRDVPVAERREAERFPCDLQPSWSIWGKGWNESWDAKVHDVSVSGISLLLRRWIKPGTVLVIKLQTPNQRLSRPMPARVMHSTQQADGAWQVGCSFVRRLSDEDLHTLLHQE